MARLKPTTRRLLAIHPKGAMYSENKKMPGMKIRRKAAADALRSLRKKHGRTDTAIRHAASAFSRNNGWA